MKALKITLGVVLSIFVMTSCGNNKKQEKEAESAFDLDAYIKAAEAIDPNLSRVDQIFNILDMVHAEYFDVLTNDPYSAHSYKSSLPIAAANLGIYMTDVIYHFYGENQEAMLLSFQAAQELAKTIGVESQLANFTFDQMEGKVVKRDTITRIFNNLLSDSEKYTSEKEMVFIHTAFLTGSFIEKVYISSNLLKHKMSDQDLTKEKESDIRELLVIYLNQLDPSTSILYDAFEKQKDQLEGLVVLTTFDRLKELSQQLQKVKPTLSLAPISEIAANQELQRTFELIANLRNVLVTAST
jgi:BMFP domain-containing protein YqiC